MQIKMFIFKMVIFNKNGNKISILFKKKQISNFI
jgi:hypothetical protein